MMDDKAIENPSLPVATHLLRPIPAVGRMNRTIQMIMFSMVWSGPLQTSTYCRTCWLVPYRSTVNQQQHFVTGPTICQFMCKTSGTWIRTMFQPVLARYRFLAQDVWHLANRLHLLTPNGISAAAQPLAAIANHTDG